MSSRPKRSTASSTAPAATPGSPTSPTIISTRVGDPRLVRREVEDRDARALLEERATIARPSPFEPPVTSAVRPSNSMADPARVRRRARRPRHSLDPQRRYIFCDRSSSISRRRPMTMQDRPLRTGGARAPRVAASGADDRRDRRASSSSAPLRRRPLRGDTRGTASASDTLVIANAVKIDTLDPAQNSVEREHLARPEHLQPARPAERDRHGADARPRHVVDDHEGRQDVHLHTCGTRSSPTARRSPRRTRAYSIVARRTSRAAGASCSTR